jgi:hypothetical protein
VSKPGPTRRLVAAATRALWKAGYTGTARAWPAEPLRIPPARRWRFARALARAAGVTAPGAPTLTPASE